jgi:hypothetical protein
MATDNTKLNYLSTWDIDQLVATGEVAVSSGNTAIVTVPTTGPALPLFEVYFKPGSSSKWFQVGQYSTANTLATVQNCYSGILNRQLYLYSSTSGIARYFIWQDRLDN